MDSALLCTAIGRAQEQVVPIGDRDVFERAVVAPPQSARRNVGIGR